MATEYPYNDQRGGKLTTPSQKPSPRIERGITRETLNTPSGDDVEDCRTTEEHTDPDPDFMARRLRGIRARFKGIHERRVARRAQRHARMQAKLKRFEERRVQQLAERQAQ
jgi:hypothetical protein